MRSGSRANSHTQAVLVSALAILALTAVHHVYGAIRYHTPWRHHAALAALVVSGALLLLYARSRRDPAGVGGRRAAWAMAWLSLLVPILGIGLFEGLYNHLVKNVLFFAGLPRPLFLQLFPPPTYEVPGDAFFEITGVLQAVLGAFAARAWWRFVRTDAQETRRRIPAGAAVSHLDA